MVSTWETNTVEVGLETHGARDQNRNEERSWENYTGLIGRNGEEI